MVTDWSLITVYCLLPTAFCLLLYWELILAEGAHLGPRVVIPLYNWIAHGYDHGIKKFDAETESEILGLPLAAELAERGAPRVLDVAAGTGRVARALLREVAFDGSVVSVDLARRMLATGRGTCAAWPERVSWVQAPSGRLPFANRHFDCVTCLEALEFFPDARAALGECLRVLKPGGLLLVTNRVGWEARLIVGKTFSRPAFRQLLADLGLEAVRVEPWQVDYDLAWARKPGGENE
jgi:SAM-dependent methyltransferase